MTKKMYLHQHGGKKPRVARRYDASFVPSQEYLKRMPDMLNAEQAIEGAQVAIQQVGVSNFRLPILVGGKSSKVAHRLEASVLGTVSLEAAVKGINMSRIVRSFYDFKDERFTVETLPKILARYRKSIGSFDARVKIRFSYPILQQSLRSGLSGYQFYDVAYEAVIDRSNRLSRFVEFDFVYSSACPCSAELAEHAREERGAYGIPHSQRSRARIKVELAPGKKLFPEDLQELCLKALKTETQVMVKREDEQAFAELNGTHIKFVEDAARLLFERLDSDSRISDFQVACAHLESLHSHDAVSVICKGVKGGLRADISDFQSLIC